MPGSYFTFLVEDPRPIRLACLSQIESLGDLIKANARVLRNGERDKELANIERAAAHTLALQSIVSQIDGDLAARRAEEDAERERALERRLAALDDLLDALPIDIPPRARRALRSGLEQYEGVDAAWLLRATPGMLVGFPGVGWKTADAVCDAIKIAGLDGGQS